MTISVQRDGVWLILKNGNGDELRVDTSFVEPQLVDFLDAEAPGLKCAALSAKARACAGPTIIPPVRALLAVANKTAIHDGDREALRMAGVLVIEFAAMPAHETRLMSIDAPMPPFVAPFRTLTDAELKELSAEMKRKSRDPLQSW